jgi:hypothetical protein
MPYENYGQKGMSAKANTNAPGVVDEAADPVNEHELAPENPATSRAADAPENKQAKERPEEDSKHQSQKN